MNLKELLAEADRLHGLFNDACVKAGFADYWEAYKSENDGNPWPEEVKKAWEAQRDALHAYYGARDGDKGFLGGRGL